MNKIIPILFALLLLLASCGDDEPRRQIDRPDQKPTGVPLKVDLSKTGAYFYEDTIFMTVKPMSDNVEIVSLSIEDHQIGRDLGSFTNGLVAIPTQLSGGGDLKLRLSAKYSDGTESVRYKEVKVLAREKPQNGSFQVVKKYPHDNTSFTQGLLMHEGFLYEGTGNYGETRLRKLELTTGKVLREENLASDIFGEGITIFKDRIYQLTYKSSKAFVYDLESFDKVQEALFYFSTGEGWGLTHNDTSLIASDGSAYLYFLDPAAFGELKRIRVFDDKGMVENINELEYRNGIIYANIYTKFRIIAIDALSGMIIEEYDARDILASDDRTNGMDVLNGIAENQANGNLLLTGKYWSKLYEVRPVLEDEF